MNEKREAVLHLRLTRSEEQYLKRKAKLSHCTVSDYVRNQVRETEFTPPAQADWGAYAQEINEIGQDIDAIAAQGNSIGWVDPDSYDLAVNELYEILERVERELDGE